MSNIEDRANVMMRNAIKELLFTKPYYAYILVRVKKGLDFSQATAYVTIEGADYKMMFNPFFVVNQTLEQLTAILEHETCHLCYNHLNMTEFFKHHQVANIAMDIEINQHVGKDRFLNGHMTKEQFENTHEARIEELQKEVSEKTISKEEMYKIISEEKLLYFCFVEDYFPNDLKKGSRWYYKKLLEENPSQQCQVSIAISGASDIDPNPKDEETGQEVSTAQRELLKNSFENLIKGVDSDLKGQGRGVLPMDIQGWIEATIKGKEQSISWKAALKKFIQGGVKPETVSTRKRSSRRFGEGFPGSKLRTVPRGIIYWDQSGSVSNKEHEMLFEELQHIYKTGVEIDIAPFNSQVLKTYKYKGEKKYTVTGGGTDFDVCQQHFAEQQGYSFCVMFTDGCAPVPKKFKKPCIWIITQKRYMDYDFPGMKVLMKEQINSK
jgi:predicted metal-dependent peptidase